MAIDIHLSGFLLNPIKLRAACCSEWRSGGYGSFLNGRGPAKFHLEEDKYEKIIDTGNGIGPCVTGNGR